MTGTEKRERMSRVRRNLSDLKERLRDGRVTRSDYNRLRQDGIDCLQEIRGRASLAQARRARLGQRATKEE